MGFFRSVVMRLLRSRWTSAAGQFQQTRVMIGRWTVHISDLQYVILHHKEHGKKQFECYRDAQGAAFKMIRPICGTDIGFF